MRFGSLFSGIGGLDLGLERAGMECVWQVEIDDYCTKVLEKHWPDVRRYRDVKEVHGIVAHATGTGARKNKQGLRSQPNGLREGNEAGQVREGCPSCLEPVDLIVGGFPCQPHSVAGKRKGAADDRNLWPEFIRIIRETKPRYVLAENVPGIITTYLDTVLSDLEGEGYTCTTFNIPACGFDAPHRRGRIFIVAYTESYLRGTPRNDRPESLDGGGSLVGDTEKFGRNERETEKSRENWEPRGKARGSSGTLSHPSSEGPEKRQGRRPRETFHASVKCDWWTVEPDVGRVAHGIPSRVDRLRGLGNAVVPQVAEWIGRRIMDNE